jgi:ADP-ribose pyrophosphatase YjhB (NUDIX family)
MQERLETALRRICREETGLTVRVEKIIGVIEYIRLGRWSHSVSIVYLVRPIRGKLRGSSQARNISFFKSLPEHTLREVKDFLIENRLIRK